MLERVQSNDVGQLMWADNSWGAVRRGVRGKGVGRVKCRAQGSETRQSELGCMGLHEGEGGGVGEWNAVYRDDEREWGEHYK